jgi:hypothetical protein
VRRRESLIGKEGTVQAQEDKKVEPRGHRRVVAVKFEILNPKHETNTKSEFSNVQNVTT